ncbi:MAG: esterase [Bacteroidota bacterium]
MKKYILLLFLAIALISCSKDPDIESSSLDSGLFFDQSLYTPEKYLVSVAKPNPTPAEKIKPVIIAVHGYGATTFEWDEFKSWAGTRTDFSISQVLLGGHGRDYQTFKDSSWEDWRKPIIAEFEALEKAGYTNISFAGSSTGSTLILEMLASGYFNIHLKPRHVFLIDPILIPADKTLSLVGALGPIIGYTTVDNATSEEKYYYHYRPYETLKELKAVIGKVRKNLEKGFKLPANCTLQVFKSDKDDVADPVSAVLIHKGLKTFDGGTISVSMISSSLHVFTRLSGRAITPSAKDLDNQNQAFNNIAIAAML